MRQAIALAICVATILSIAGCGSGSDSEPMFAPAAEPADSPPLETKPEGKVVDLGSEPEGLAADPRSGLLAVGLREPAELALLSMDSLRVERRVSLSESPRHLQLAAPGGPFLVPAERADELIEVDPLTGEQQSTSVGGYPHDAAQVGDLTFVGNEFGDTVSVIRKGSVAATLPAPVQPGGVEADTDGEFVAVMGVAERAIALFDTEQLVEVAREPVGVGPTHLSAVGDSLFVVDTEGDALIELSLDPSLRVLGSTPLEGTPYGIAADPRRDRLWVTLTASNQVAEVALDGTVRRTLPTVRQPNTVAVDPRSGRVFVASRTEGLLQYFDPDRP